MFGSTAPPENVTIRAIYVAGVSVTRTEFNFRGWQVDVPRSRLDAIATDEQARLPVIAFTSIGCAALPPERQPLVRFPDSDEGPPDGSNGGAGGGLP